MFIIGNTLYTLQLLTQYGADGGNRTRVESLEGFRSTIELRPRNLVAGYSVRRRIAAVTTRVGWVVLILLVVIG